MSLIYQGYFPLQDIQVPSVEFVLGFPRAFEMSSRDDPEHLRAIQWIRSKEVTVPSVVHNGEVIYQIRHVPVRAPENPLKYDRVNGLGYFHMFKYVWLREFLDDRLNIATICKLGSTSKEFALYASDEKLWRRYARRLYKGNLDFSGSWKHSVIQWHNRKFYKEKGLPYSPLPAPASDPSVAPWWEGMDEELVKMFKRWYRASVNPRYFEVTSPQDQIDRRSASELTVDEFIEKYERASKPVLISGITKKWAAQYNWTKEKLLERHADTKFRTGGGFKMKLRRFFRYLERQHEQQPLYLFDQNYPENAEPMGSEYAVPPYFPEDLFEITGEDDRPPYRWILVGPAGSGAPFHTDPRGTSAWNTVLSGKKRWAMYPPTIHPPGVGPDNSDYYDAPTAVKWYMKVFPQVPEDNRPQECLQEPGELFFVPSGWWHMVLNLGDCELNVAVTHNYVSSQNFDLVAEDLINDSDDEFTEIFRKKLRRKKPELYQRFRDAERRIKKRKRRDSASDSDSDSSDDSSSSASSSTSDSTSESDSE